MFSTQPAVLVNRNQNSASVQCGEQNCSITVLIRETGAKWKPVGGIDAEVLQNPGPKTTTAVGLAQWSGLPSGRDYTVRVALTAQQQRRYALAGPPEQTKSILCGVDKLYMFEVMPLAWPKVKLSREDNGAAAGNVAVVLSGGFDLGTTATSSGLAAWPDGNQGLRGRTYAVAFTFTPEDAERCEIVQTNPAIDVPQGSRDIYSFTVRVLSTLEVKVRRKDNNALVKEPIKVSIVSVGQSDSQDTGKDTGAYKFRKLRKGSYTVSATIPDSLADRYESIPDEPITPTHPVEIGWGEDKTAVIKVRPLSWVKFRVQDKATGKDVAQTKWGLKVSDGQGRDGASEQIEELHTAHLKRVPLGSCDLESVEAGDVYEFVETAPE